MQSPAADAAAARSAPASAAPPSPAEGARSALQTLCARRDQGETLPAAAQPLDLSGERFVDHDLSGLDLSGVDFSGAEFIRCVLAGSRLIGANLTGAMLYNIDLSNVELLGADVSGADFSNANLERAGFGKVVGRETGFFGARCAGATFSGADLTGGDLRTARLETARMLDTTLAAADLTGAVLSEVDLTGAGVADACFRDADLRGAQLRNVTDYKTADWINADVQNVDFTGAWLIRRHILDENYIHEFRSQSKTHERLYLAWWITSNCGRSLMRWSMWTVLVALVYAAAYTQVEIDWGGSRTPWSPVYYSVVTFTTLGYGDVLPGSSAAQLLAMSEVILGYFSLGGMMSILSDKMARRAG